MSGSTLNIIIKITAVLLAVLLWLNVITDKQYEYDITLPIASIDLPQGLASIMTLPDSLSVTIMATGKKIWRSDWKKSGLRLRASRLKRGINNLEISTATVTLMQSEDIDLIGFPNTTPMVIHLDRIDSLYKPIVSKLAVICEEDFLVVEDEGGISPAQVKIIGPASAIRHVDTIYTESKIADDIDISGTYTLKLNTPSDVPITLSVDSAIVEIVVDRKATREFTSVPLMYNRIIHGKKLFVEPDNISLKISGPQSKIELLTTSNLQVMIIPPADASDVFVKPHVSLPQNFSLEEIMPDSVRIVLSQ
ncbi:MAG: hypothetical protein KAR42_13500 [candidate division Zixibacteria bacterium]|nr:hypothetical protein [candidate division Zixibacteria bacterium]